MYSRNTRSEREYSVPPGYDGNRFRRRRRGEGEHASDEVILIPDSDFAPISESHKDSEELSVGGIPTSYGIRENRKRYSAENTDDVQPTLIPEEDMQQIEKNENTTKKHDKLSGLLEKLGFAGGLSSDDLLICAVIFLIASDADNEGKNTGDILLILAFLLAIR